MRRLLASALLLAPLAACGQPAAKVDVTDAWARATVAEQTSAAVFMTLASPTDDRLVGAATDVAGETDLMTMSTDDGAMAMAYVQDIALPANQPVNLDPSGLHVWLADLKQPLKAGESFPLTLEFEKAGEQQVTVSIIAPAAAPPMSGMPM